MADTSPDYLKGLPTGRTYSLLTRTGWVATIQDGKPVTAINRECAQTWTWRKSGDDDHDAFREAGEVTRGYFDEVPSIVIVGDAA